MPQEHEDMQHAEEEKRKWESSQEAAKKAILEHAFESVSEVVQGEVERMSVLLCSVGIALASPGRLLGKSGLGMGCVWAAVVLVGVAVWTPHCGAAGAHRAAHSLGHYPKRDIVVLHTRGVSPRFWYATSPPSPPLPALRAHLVAKGQ